MVYELPQTVVEAALVLDKDKPDWFRLVNLDIFNMGDCEKCISAQVYKKDWRDVQIRLFGKDNIESNEGKKTRNIFAGSNILWIKEILFRRYGNKTDEVHDFIWAMLRIKESKKIRQSDWAPDHYWYYHFGDRRIKSHNGQSGDYPILLDNMSVDIISAKNWEEYTPKIRFIDLKVGQKFCFAGDSIEEYRKVQFGNSKGYMTSRYIIYDESAVLNSEVIIIEEAKS